VRKSGDLRFRFPHDYYEFTTQVSNCNGGWEKVAGKYSYLFLLASRMLSHIKSYKDSYIAWGRTHPHLWYALGQIYEQQLTDLLHHITETPDCLEIPKVKCDSYMQRMSDIAKYGPEPTTSFSNDPTYQLFDDSYRATLKTAARAPPAGDNRNKHGESRKEKDNKKQPVMVSVKNPKPDVTFTLRDGEKWSDYRNHLGTCPKDSKGAMICAKFQLTNVCDMGTQCKRAFSHVPITDPALKIQLAAWVSTTREQIAANPGAVVPNTKNDRRGGRRRN